LRWIRRRVAFRRSFLIALIYDNPSPQYVVNMQRGILDTLEGTSFQLIVRPCDRGDPQFLLRMRAFIEQQNLFGAILPPSVSEDQALATS
jgi:LacI family transcriptional regulator